MKDGVVQLKASQGGTLWLNSRSASRDVTHFRTIRFEPDRVAPETEITVSLSSVSQPGNTVISWKGADPWGDTPDSEIQYACRLDGGDWFPFSSEKYRVFLGLSAGSHTFEVKARDRDFNEDPTPAVVRFVVGR